MRFLIDQLKLKLLLEEKREYIGYSKYQGLDVLITGIVFAVSLLCSEFKTIWIFDRLVIQTIAWIIAIVLIVYGAYRMYIARKHRYNHHSLYRDIENLNQVLHAFSIVALKDTYNTYANRFLLYYDETWKCWFFFNFKTSDNENERSIKQRLSNKLKVGIDNISLRYITDRLQPKFSERDQVDKIYQHSLYECVLSKFSEELMKDSFELDGVNFKWFTIEEMESNSDVMKKNKDVVSFVKEKIA